MDMMFNTEMIVKDMKGGKEDMTEKQLDFSKWSLKKDKLYIEYSGDVELKIGDVVSSTTSNLPYEK